MSAAARLARSALLALAFSATLATGKPAEPLAADPLTEKRLVDISSELRCLVCQNESLAGSQADLAVDLRREIREMIRAGRSDTEIMDFMVSRYGDFVRYRPPLNAATLLLWFGPPLFLVAGLIAFVRYLRRRDRTLAELPPDPAAQARAARLLDDDGPDR